MEFDKDILRLFKEAAQYEYDFLKAFIELERQKPECLCKEIEKVLIEKIENNDIAHLLVGEQKCSSGRKISEFDQIGTFNSYVLKNGLPVFEETNTDKYQELCLDEKIIYFSVEEIESYARAYRIVPDELQEDCVLPKLVQIFEFKPPKI